MKTNARKQLIPDQFISRAGVLATRSTIFTLTKQMRARWETEAWLRLAESIDDGGPVMHSARVGTLAARLGLEVGLSGVDIAALELGARLHDIGKLFIPAAILLSPEKLSNESRVLMQTHTEKGAALLASATCPTVRSAAQVARHHHERWDGTGYPDRLKGEEIPLVARITALADVYDALRHKRSYKSAWSHQDTVREIAAGRGTHFDPRLTDIFLRILAVDVTASEQYLYATDALKARWTSGKQLHDQASMHCVKNANDVTLALPCSYTSPRISAVVSE